MYIVMGLPGAGKTTVLEKLKERRPDYKIINYGDIALALAKEMFGITHRDEIRKKLTFHQYKHLQERVEEYLVRVSQEEEKVILDTHCAIKTPNGYLPGLPFRFLSKLKVDGVILISATPEEVVARRKKDEGKTERIRDEDDIRALEEHDFINRAMLAAYSVISGAPAVIIMNHDGRLEEAVEKLASVLKG